MDTRKSNLLPNGGTLFQLSKNLTEAVFDHGGSDYHVRQILKPNNPLLRALAKKIVGPMWEAVEKPVRLDVDFELDMKKFNQLVHLTHNLSISQALFSDVELQFPRFQEHRVVTPRNYQLVHFQEPVRAEDVTQSYQVAGYRELCTFLLNVPLSPFTGICALESSYCSANPDRYSGMHYVVAYANSHGNITIGRTEMEIFSNDYFFLTRTE